MNLVNVAVSTFQQIMQDPDAPAAALADKSFHEGGTNPRASSGDKNRSALEVRVAGILDAVHGNSLNCMIAKHFIIFKKICLNNSLILFVNFCIVIIKQLVVWGSKFHLLN